MVKVEELVLVVEQCISSMVEEVELYHLEESVLVVVMAMEQVVALVV